jgi:hypothetical protein
MRGFWLFGIVGMIGLSTIDAVGAVAKNEPYLAVRTGFKCSQCHTNRTGGGKRNAFGNIYVQTRLPITVIGTGDDGAFLDTQLSRSFSLGADVRVATAREFTGENPKNPINLEEGALYVEARVVPEVLTIYADQLIAPGNTRNRELFVLVGSLPWQSYLKVGRFFLPYGLRLQDDGEFIRQRTGFNFSNSDLGIELGLEPGPLSLAVALSNGTQGAAENDSKKLLSGLASVVFSWFRIGAAASRNEADTGRRDVVGAFGGLSLGRFDFLGELDYMSDDPAEGEDLSQFAVFVEGNFLAIQGLNFKVTYGFLDPDRDIGENARVRLRFGANSFITQFLEVSIFYTLLEDIPQVQTDRDFLSLQVHAFF